MEWMWGSQESRRAWMTNGGIGKGRVVLPVARRLGPQRYRQWIRFALCGSMDHSFESLINFEVNCRRMLIQRREYNEILRGKLITKYLWANVKIESEHEDLLILRTGNCNCRTDLSLRASPRNSASYRTTLP